MELSALDKMKSLGNETCHYCGEVLHPSVFKTHVKLSHERGVYEKRDPNNKWEAKRARRSGTKRAL